MGADGFRLDAIKHLIENGREQENTRETHAWLREYRRFLKQIAPESFTVGEVFDSRPTILERYYPDQLDTYFEFGIGEGIINAANTGFADSYIKAVQTAYQRLPFQRWAPFLSNHDQVRVMNRLGGDPARMRVAAIALLTLPGLPFVYYGEEIGMDGIKPDERLRTPMQWENTPGVGFTAGTPWQAPQTDLATANVATQNAEPGSLLNLYRQLIHLHTTTPALGSGDFLPLTVEGASSGAAFLRRSGDQTALVLINFGSTPLRATLTAPANSLPPGTYTLRTLLGELDEIPLTVEPNGTLNLTFPSDLAPQQGWIFLLE
jgi:glycosidase